MTEPHVDYHREKYGLVALAHYLEHVDGWLTVRLSVEPESLDAAGGPAGQAVPAIDEARDREDPRYKYTLYTDNGGRIDLVATKSGRTLLVEAKGTSTPVPAGIEQLIGRSILSMRAGRPDLSYAILIPDVPRRIHVI